ncbi:hypothetical protein A2Z33_06420 [Candidatus Gottesmanbacteria bacterium RBG_16_52_11]|uniref:Uncharacterized protein n=1 Tax=Candidatus Gottesmanbacteria bacterium RBG_16_52_11 TaxID=1798374 RepID=A0A1F5YXP2_9BACT|nr:MAG: hypothetical protein A2Z33_06420 [Candidatus Gottesmanbacteria bacterium RBG_16_52_11]
MRINYHPDKHQNPDTLIRFPRPFRKVRWIPFDSPSLQRAAVALQLNRVVNPVHCLKNGS